MGREDDDRWSVDPVGDSAADVSMTAPTGSRIRPARLRAWQRRALARSESGQAVIEVACAITVILVLVVGIVEFSPAVVRTAQLTQAAREGVSYARTAPTDTFGIRKRVVQAVPVIYGTLTDAQITAMTNSQIAVTCASDLNGASKAC